jgi:excisionase family DNA binding protein
LKEVAVYMAGHLWAVRELIRLGKIPYQKVGRGYVIDRFDLDQYLEKNKQAA